MLVKIYSPGILIGPHIYLLLLNIKHSFQDRYIMSTLVKIWSTRDELIPNSLNYLEIKETKL